MFQSPTNNFFLGEGASKPATERLAPSQIMNRFEARAPQSLKRIFVTMHDLCSQDFANELYETPEL